MGVSRYATWGLFRGMNLVRQAETSGGSRYRTFQQGQLQKRAHFSIDKVIGQSEGECRKPKEIRRCQTEHECIKQNTNLSLRLTQFLLDLLRSRRHFGLLGLILINEAPQTTNEALSNDSRG